MAFRIGEYVLYKVYFDQRELEHAIILLEKNSIDYFLDNKSNPENFSTPSSSYTKVDLFINAQDYEKASTMLSVF